MIKQRRQVIHKLAKPSFLLGLYWSLLLFFSSTHAQTDGLTFIFSDIGELNTEGQKCTERLTNYTRCCVFM
jgi:hypothetical protein